MRRCSERVNCVKLKQLVAMQEKVVLLLQTIVEDPLMRHSAVLVFANKQDLVRAQPAAVNLVSASLQWTHEPRHFLGYAERGSEYRRGV